MGTLTILSVGLAIVGMILLVVNIIIIIFVDKRGIASVCNSDTTDSSIPYSSQQRKYSTGFSYDKVIDPTRDIYASGVECGNLERKDCDRT